MIKLVVVLVGFGLIETSLSPILDNKSSMLVTSGGLFCKKPLLKPTPLGDLKSVIEMVSPVLMVNEYPPCVASNPPILIVNGVMDCAVKIDVVSNKKKKKNSPMHKMILIIHLRQLELAEWG